MFNRLDFLQAHHCYQKASFLSVVYFKILNILLLLIANKQASNISKTTTSTEQEIFLYFVIETRNVLSLYPTLISVY